jgi:hypothetical protein
VISTQGQTARVGVEQKLFLSLGSNIVTNNELDMFHTMDVYPLSAYNLSPRLRWVFHRYSPRSDPIRPSLGNFIPPWSNHLDYLKLVLFLQLDLGLLGRLSFLIA